MEDKIGSEIYVKNERFIVEKYLGKGKSGYSYLISNGDKKYVYKQIHHEPCAYYNFGDKLMAEVHAYDTLKNAGARIPEIVEYNHEKEYLIKEYIEGKTAAELAAGNEITEAEFDDVFEMAKKVYSKNIIIDFFPTNFVYGNNHMYYVDYECNGYNEEWNFENWGIYFWLNSEGIKEHLEKGESPKLCLQNSAKPVTEPFKERANYLIEKYSRKN